MNSENSRTFFEIHSHAFRFLFESYLTGNQTVESTNSFERALATTLDCVDRVLLKTTSFNLLEKGFAEEKANN